MNHKTCLEAYDGTLEMLAEEIGNLRYDSLADFLKLLSAKIERDGEKDLLRNRVKLASCLKNCSSDLDEASVAIDRAWKICSPYCQENNKQAHH